MDRIITYAPDFPRFLGSLAKPVALVPPALFELLGNSVTAADLAKALERIGFREMRCVSSAIGGVTAGLEAEAKAHTDGPLLFSACPGVQKIARSEYPAVSSMFSSIVPPAERVALEARRAHPEATLFFLSPCSSRAKSLLSRKDPDGTDRVLVDFAVPLATMFPAIPEAVEAVTGRYPASAGTRAGLSRAPSGLAGIAPSTASLRSWFEEFSRSGHEAQAGTVIELVVCKDGCSKGDWAPRG